ncbi:uncharacterized protein OCT59_011468 [Rhizophagus irregularis]|uniref:uncharacterized protein n=1 Tax=Rhizophagus irregularis TaxID=588596 RepID=UPI003317FC22|nr:hypothetical protein OCT59_011468 [Rhizophagus irregularis]
MIHREEHDSTMYLYLRLMLRCDTVSAVGVALASASAAVSHQQSVPHQQMALQLGTKKSQTLQKSLCYIHNIHFTFNCQELYGFLLRSLELKFLLQCKHSSINL